MGGIETVTDTLATAFAELGYQVVVVTPTQLSYPNLEIRRNYKVIRKPSAKYLLNAVKECDVFIHNSISLKNIWPLFFFQRKWIVVHHGPLYSHSLKLKLIAKLKLFATTFAINVGVSSFIGKQFSDKCLVIPNPIDLHAFLDAAIIPKSLDFVFVGRLVREKGAHLFIQALKVIQDLKPQFQCSIIGDGPELDNLKREVEELKLSSNITFTGKLTGNELITSIAKHKVMVIPSIWKEPFGVVALEGMACGCNIIASNTGGLPEAVGNCGLLIEPYDILGLSKAMEESLNLIPNKHLVNEHLSRHSSSNIANEFLKIFS